MRKKGILDWFKWESKAAAAARQARYYARMYPFGQEQKDWEIKTIKELFPKKKDITELHFDLLTLREVISNAMLPEDDDEYESIKEGMSHWDNTNFSRLRKDGSAKTLKAMAYLETAAKSLDELPSVEDIRADENLY